MSETPTDQTADHDQTPGRPFGVGEWRCLNFGMGPLVNAGSWIGLFVRVA